MAAVADLALRVQAFPGTAVHGAIYARCRAEQELATRFCEPCAEVAAKSPGWSPLLDEDLTWWCFGTGVAGPPINPLTGEPAW